MEITNGKLHIDHSRRSCANSCLRKYYWQYVRELVPSIGSNALRYGSTWHGFLDGLYRSVKLHGWGNPEDAYAMAFNEGKKVWERESSLQSFYDDYRTFENCGTSFLNYINYYSADRNMLEVTQVERAFSIEFDRFIFDGKLDLQILLNGVKWLVEHKTTSQAIAMQSERMNRAMQTIGYFHACDIIGEHNEGVMISFHHISARKVKSGGYGNLSVDFSRCPQLYCKQNIDDWKALFLHDVQRIEEAYETGIWPKNYDSCYQYGRCGYLPLCDQYRPLGEEVLDSVVHKEWDVKKTVEKVIYAVV